MRDFNAVYDLTKISSDSEKSDCKLDDQYPMPIKTITPFTKTPLIESKPNLVNLANAIMENNFDSLYSSCKASKQIRALIQKKPIIEIDEKLHKVHVDL